MKKSHAIVKPLTHAILIAIPRSASGALADTDKTNRSSRYRRVGRAISVKRLVLTLP